MRDVNSEDTGDTGRPWSVAESIERGGGGLGVTELLAKVAAAEAAPQPPDGSVRSPAPVSGPGPASGPVSASEPAADAMVLVAEAVPAPEPVPDVDAVAAVIAAAAGRHLPEGCLAPDADFFDAGGTSVHAVEFVAELERDLGVELDLDEVFADARPISLARHWVAAGGTAAALANLAARPHEAPGGPGASGVPGARGVPGTHAALEGAAVLGVPAALEGSAVPEGPAAPKGPATPEGPTAATAQPTPAAPADQAFPPAGAAPAPAAPARPALAAQASPSTAHVPAPTARVAVPAPPSTVASSPAVPHTRARREDLDQILADLALADRLPFVDVPEPLPPRRILLTGATGFLGSHMLLDLLRHSDAHVHCLVRAPDEAAAVERLAAQLRGYRLPWSAEVRRRITVLPGDIRRPRLGLSEELWHTLAHELDAVVGVAAAVDFLRGYPSLRGSNVLGALTLAELAATGRPKPLHHISSIAVFNEVGITSMGEDDPLAHVDRLVAGYDQSKWAAEVALRRARDHGLVVSALRPGGIGGHTRTGAHNPQDLSSGLISAFGRFRTVPAFRCLNAAPVDWVSRVAVAVVCEPDAWGFDYNLTGVPNTLDDVVRDMALGGMHVRVRDWDEWRTDALARLEADPVPELGFLNRVLRSPTALRLCEATLQGPAATGDRTAALVAALDLPPAARYDARAQARTFESLAADGLARLPQKDDPPYLWFTETTRGGVRPVDGVGDDRHGPDGDVGRDGGDTGAATPCSMALTLSIAGMHQLVGERRMDVTGEVRCPAVHPEPLTVERGDVWVRPEEGIPHRHGLRHQLLRYRLRLIDADGGAWWLEGHKYARARRDLWRQTRALSVEIGREGGPAALVGEVVVPADSYVRDQIDGIRVAPHLTEQEGRAAKLTWLAWFGREMGRGLLGPFARAAAELLDLRRTPTPREQHR